MADLQFSYTEAQALTSTWMHLKAGTSSSCSLRACARGLGIRVGQDKERAYIAFVTIQRVTRVTDYCYFHVQNSVKTAFRRGSVCKLWFCRAANSIFPDRGKQTNPISVRDQATQAQLTGDNTEAHYQNEKELLELEGSTDSLKFVTSGEGACDKQQLHFAKKSALHTELRHETDSSGKLSALPDLSLAKPVYSTSWPLFHTLAAMLFGTKLWQAHKKSEQLCMRLFRKNILMTQSRTSKCAKKVDNAEASDKHWDDTESVREQVGQLGQTTTVVITPLDVPVDAKSECLCPICFTGRDLVKDKVATVIILYGLFLHFSCGKKRQVTIARKLLLSSTRL
ncbi:hypothetical protein Anapl_04142 [Anas platyrhynchos]|uniref:Uncharacterized protein n=1 Tax=Anas platyrhynchos TaxID=8839 RepID=R0K0Q4_ANAPL|nr:hypothetical protein Anapl_04142 [Anas platyrhynchos]